MASPILNREDFQALCLDHDIHPDDVNALAASVDVFGQEVVVPAAAPPVPTASPPPSPNLAERAKDWLSYKHRGVPRWGWGLIGGAVVGGGYYLLRK